MAIAHKIDVNLSQYSAPSTVHMMQGDADSRMVLATLWNGSVKYIPESGVATLIRFGKPDGKGGLYNKTETGHKVVLTDSCVTIPIARQVLTVPGIVRVQIELYKGEERVSAFPFQIHVVESSKYNAETISEGYVNTSISYIVLGQYPSVSALKSAHPTGNAGDAWFVGTTDTNVVYQWDTDKSDWVNVGTLKGPRGEVGAQGPKGETGPVGPKGDIGAQGPKGNAFTYADFTAAQLAALRGEKGERGDRGPVGPQGETGPQGPQGERGPIGAQGPQGADGASYTVKGLYATFSALQAAHPTGSAGDAWFVGTAESNTVYQWDTDAAAWVNVGALKGPQGETGAQGPKGEKGDPGATGPQGEQGVQGEQGPAGANGEDGVTPHIGTNGHWYLGDTDTGTAAQGPAGQDGAKGDPGDTGPQGPQGETGPQGPQGPQGNSGAAGAAGKSAYQAAKDGGYTGTESAFNTALAQVSSKITCASWDSSTATLKLQG